MFLAARAALWLLDPWRPYDAEKEDEEEEEEKNTGS